jgi:hypothetical protein
MPTTSIKALVKRSQDKGYREVVMVVDWSGLPPFADNVIGLYLFFLILDETVWCQTGRIEEMYWFSAKDELEKLMFQIGTEGESNA